MKTLEQLIKECGYEFGSLRNPVVNYWFAEERKEKIIKCKECGLVKEFPIIVHGKTPKEAVLKLLKKIKTL